MPFGFFVMFLVVDKLIKVIKLMKLKNQITKPTNSVNLSTLLTFQLTS